MDLTAFHYALLDILELPATGHEENVADQFATIMLLNEGPQGTQAAISMAYVFNQGDGFTFDWGRHSFDSQRYYNILCLVAGYHDGNRVGETVKSYIPSDRAVWCSSEYKDAVAAWDALLFDHAPTI